LSYSSSKTALKKVALPQALSMSSFPPTHHGIIGSTERLLTLQELRTDSDGDLFQLPSICAGSTCSEEGAILRMMTFLHFFLIHAFPDSREIQKAYWFADSRTNIGLFEKE
jgi:hypothetical protein